MKCAQCGYENRKTAKLCKKCGASLSKTAGKPEKTSLEQQFATFRESLPSSMREKVLTQADGENRIVTVLFADMSSSVRTTADLSPEDGAALVNNLLKAMMDVLSEYEGRIDRFLGDGLLAVFGTPTAHESDPERAVLAALQIRERARELQPNVAR